MTAVALLLLIVAVFVVFHSYKDQIRSKIEQEIAFHINGTMVFDDVSISVFKDFPNLTLTLEKVIVTDPQHLFTNDTLATVDELDIEFKTSSFIIGDKTEIKSLNVKQPSFHIEILPNGLANYNILQNVGVKVNTTGDSSSVNLELDQIEILNGTLVYEDMKSKLFFNMKGIAFSGSGEFQHEILDLETQTEINQFTLTYGTVRYFFDKHVWIDLMMEMNLKENLFTLKENKIQINHFKFDVEGNFALLQDAYDFDLKFKTQETSFKNILSLVPGIYMEDFKQIKTAGELEFNGFIKGRYAQDTLPSFLANIKVKDGMLKIDTLPAPVENIQLDLVVRNDYNIPDSTIIDLKNFHMDMQRNPIHGRFKLKGYTHYFVDADVMTDIELSELEKMFPIPGLVLQGKLTGELQAKGKYIPTILQDSILWNSPDQIPMFHMKMRLTNGKLKYNHLPSAIENIQFHLIADNTNGKVESTKVDVKEFHADLGKNPVHGFIKIVGYKNYTVDADITANVDLEDLEKIYPIDSTTILKGKLDVDVEAKGMYNPSLKNFPMIDAHLNLTNGYYKSSDRTEPVENIRLITEAVNKTGKLKDTQLKINRLTYTLENEPFEVSGSISDLENFDYDLKIKGLIDLQRITKIYPAPGYQLKGLIDTDIETRGSIADLETGQYDKIISDGSVEVKDFELTGSAIPQKVQVKDALFTFTPLKIVLERFQGKFGKSNITLTGDLSDYMAFATKNNDLISGDLKLICDTLDINEWYGGKSISTDTTKATSKFSAKKIALQVPRNFDFVFDSKIGWLQYQDMSISQLDGEIKITDGTLTLHETGFNTLNAKFNVSGDYNTRDIQHPLFDFELDIQELDINRAYKQIKLVRNLAPAAANSYGQLSVSYKLQGELTQEMTPITESLKGGGEIRIAHAQINGMKIFEEISKAAKKNDFNDPHLKDFVMKTEIRDNKIFVKPFSIKLSGLNTDIEGVSTINGTLNYIVRIELLPIEKLRIPFHVTGTYDKPKVTIGKGHSLPQ